MSQKLRDYLRLFPIVSVMGSRQSGKTTFVKSELAGWKYFDLEKQSDYNRIASDIEYFLENYGNNCIIDEAQVLPELFPALRSYVDRKNKKVKIVLLGSVNPLLVKNISESLAGRIGFVELAPFTYNEIAGPRGVKIDIEKFWLCGGYPEPLSWRLQDHLVWTENYIKTFIEKDVLKYYQPSLANNQMHKLLVMLANTHAKLWNASEIASSFGISYHTVNTYIDILEKHFLVRRLLPYYANVGKRMVKHNKIYFRDTGILHSFLGINSIESLRTSPYRGFSFEG
ncbi:MAG: hypothetical protein A3J83_08710, partial [Elusimicrobia bacterium RIFOXYA2_FULL_40_6]